MNWSTCMHAAQIPKFHHESQPINPEGRHGRVVLGFTATGELTFSLRLDPEPAQVAYAREQVRKVTPGWGLAEHDDLLQLIVSELVTNALPHCDDPIELRLSYDENDLWIEVWDNDSTIPVRQDPDDDHESGRGIKLIDGLIKTYGGIRGTEERSFCAGKTVFVALSLQPGQLSGHPGRHSVQVSLRRRRADAKIVSGLPTNTS